MAGDGRSKSSQAKELGSRGGKVGGTNRAKKLSAQERSKIASQGGKAKAKNKKK